MSKQLLIRGGFVVDPDTGEEGIRDILVTDGIIAKCASSIGDEADEVIDAAGLTVLPGLVDLHVHLRDPGQTYKEDVGSGARAAARGGVTTLLAMPNTRPVMDRVERISYVENKARSLTKLHIFQSSAITKDMRGEELVNIEEICRHGVMAFSEDGKSVMNAALMKDAMERIAACGGLICDHCEEIGMVRGGVMNDDENAARLSLPGISNAVEDVIAARDAILAKASGVRLHLCHCSTADSVKIIAGAKAEGVRISAEVCPHHLILSSDDIPEDNGNFKMNPPLRSRKDIEALREGLTNGTIDCISTDHAPHSEEEKSYGFMQSPFGIVGIETSAALIYTELVKGGVLTLMQMAEKMSLNPARILGVPGGSLKEGSAADIAIFDFEESYVIDPLEFASKGRNTPFAGKRVYGRTKYTIVGGEVIYAE